VDQDGDLDLYVGSYVEFGPESRQQCPLGIDAAGNVVMGPCDPLPYPPQIGRLYRNDGNGHFADITARAGLQVAHGNTLGVAFGDYDDDGRVDLYLANDRTAGDLFHNEGFSGGFPRFRSVGVA